MKLKTSTTAPGRSSSISDKSGNIDPESQCCRIRLRAERKAGQLLKALAASG